MSKPEPKPRPQKGGSYVRDPNTGDLTRTEFTRPALTAAEKRKTEAEARKAAKAEAKAKAAAEKAKAASSATTKKEG